MRFFCVYAKIHIENRVGKIFNININNTLYDMSTQKNIQLTSYSEEFLTRNQLAKLFKCSVNTITRLTKQGMPTYFIGARQTPGKGSRPRYNLAACKEWMEARTRAFGMPAMNDFPRVL